MIIVMICDLGPVSLRQYELVYSIFACKQEFLVNFRALSHRNYEGFELINLRALSETGPRPCRLMGLIAAHDSLPLHLEQAGSRFVLQC